jgi:hypothetical protein
LLLECLGLLGFSHLFFHLLLTNLFKSGFSLLAFLHPLKFGLLYSLDF